MPYSFFSPALIALLFPLDLFAQFEKNTSRAERFVVETHSFSSLPHYKTYFAVMATESRSTALKKTFLLLRRVCLINSQRRIKKLLSLFFHYSPIPYLLLYAVLLSFKPIPPSLESLLIILWETFSPLYLPQLPSLPLRLSSSAGVFSVWSRVFSVPCCATLCNARSLTGGNSLHSCSASLTDPNTHTQTHKLFFLTLNSASFSLS